MLSPEKIKKKIEVFDPYMLADFRNMLQMLIPDSKIIPIITEEVDRRVELDRQRAENKGKVKSRRHTANSIEGPIELPKMQAVDMCECGGVVRGQPLPPCEQKATGRIFYAECDTCDYYYELILKRKKYSKRGSRNG